MLNNCGLKALQNLTEVKSVSMFTLIHLARDNGITLYLCRVEPEDLMKVPRPAIFHQKDHFVYVENGEAMPEGEYDGYVLTQHPVNEPLPHTLGKRIMGSKNAGGIAGIIGPIATGLAAAVNPLLGAAVGAGLGAARASGAFGDQGKGEWWRVATGGLSGFTGASAPAISALSAAAGEIPSAIKTGNWMAPIGAGLGQYGANVFAGGAVPAFQSASGGLLNKLGAGFQGGTGAVTNKINSFIGAKGPIGGGTEIARTAIGTPSGYSGSVTIPGLGSTSLNTAQRLAGGATGASGSSFGGFGGLFGTGGSTNLLGAAASALLPRPQLEGNALDNYSRAAQSLGIQNYSALPSATRSQLNEYVSLPLDQLAQKFYAPDDKGLRILEEEQQKQVDALMISYAKHGQDPYTSTDAQQRLTELNRQYDQAKAEYQQQVQNQAMNQAIQFKQQMLQNALAQNSFDYETAMELATYIGRDQELRYAMEAQDHRALQDVLAQIFSIGQRSSFSTLR